MLAEGPWCTHLGAPHGYPVPPQTLLAFSMPRALCGSPLSVAHEVAEPGLLLHEGDFQDTSVGRVGGCPKVVCAPGLRDHPRQHASVGKGAQEGPRPVEKGLASSGLCVAPGENAMG